MKTIKLAEWCEKTGIKYLTAWRWFKADKMPVYAYQTDSGTILVEDDSELEALEQTKMDTTDNNNTMSLFLKKTVEFSKNNSTVEDFAAYVISNFSLKLSNVPSFDAPKYSRQRPKSEEIQKHFKQFLPDKEKEEQLKAIKNSIKEGKDTASFTVDPDSINLEEPRVTDMVDTEYLGEISTVLSSMAPQNSDVHLYGNIIAEGLVTRSVDLNTTPQQQINYTGSTSQTFSSISSNNNEMIGSVAFPLTQKEIQSTVQEIPQKRNKRGRPVKER